MKTPDQSHSEQLMHALGHTLTSADARFHIIENQLREMQRPDNPSTSATLSQIAANMRELLSVKIPALELQMSTLYRNTELANKRTRQANATANDDTHTTIEQTIRPTMHAFDMRIRALEAHKARPDTKVPTNVREAILDTAQTLTVQFRALIVGLECDLAPLAHAAEHAHYHHRHTGLPILINAQDNPEAPIPNPQLKLETAPDSTVRDADDN